MNERETQRKQLIGFGMILVFVALLVVVLGVVVWMNGASLPPPGPSPSA